jgi:hypothetical protein
VPQGPDCEVSTIACAIRRAIGDPSSAFVEAQHSLHTSSEVATIIGARCWHVPAGTDRGLPGAVVAWRT